MSIDHHFPKQNNPTSNSPNAAKLIHLPIGNPINELGKTLSINLQNFQLAERLEDTGKLQKPLGSSAYI